MAKTIQMTDNMTAVTYTLEYTKKSVKEMENQGFRVAELAEKPYTYILQLFAGAFKANHRTVSMNVVERMYERMTDKDKLLQALVEMYNEPIEALMASADEEDAEKNVMWTQNWTQE